MDLLDIYDQQKNYTGQATRQKAHGDGLWHWLSIVYAYDQQGRLLVQYRNDHKMLDHSVGGHVDAGEDHAAAAHREAKEELGIDIPVILITDSVVEDSTNFLSPHATQNHFHAVYECMVPLNWEFVPNDEVSDVRPMKLSEVIAHMQEEPAAYTPGFLTTMDYYLKAKGIKAEYDISRAHKFWDKKNAKGVTPSSAPTKNN